MPLTVKGMRELRRDIRNLQPRIAMALFAEGTEAMAKSVYRTMQGTTAFSDRSGDLRRSMGYGTKPYRYRLYRRVVRLKDGIGVVGATSPYAAAIEFGKTTDSPRRERSFVRAAGEAGGKAAANAGYLAMKRAFQRNFGSGSPAR